MATLEVQGLTKRFGAVTAVDDMSFSVPPGQVTAFLGPNGAGKTTTLRILLGLVSPTAGTATIDGQAYRDLPHPTSVVGAVLESSGFHPGRSALDHLRVLATASGLPGERIGPALAQVGLDDARHRRVGGFSLGMRQRLGLASALLGDPQVLILDEPANGLDPAGVHWLRGFLRAFAEAGRSVLVSSHLLGEVAQVADDVAIIARGRLVTSGPLGQLTDQAAGTVRVRTPQPAALRSALDDRGIAHRSSDGHVVLAEGTTTEAVGEAAAGAGVTLHELTTERSNLEDVFLQLTAQAGDSG